MLEIKLRLVHPESCVLKNSNIKSAKLLRCNAYQDTIANLFEIRLNCPIGEFLKKLEGKNINYKEVLKISKDVIKAFLLIKNCILVKAFLETNCLFKDIEVSNEDIIVTLIVPSKNVNNLFENLDKYNIKYRIMYIRILKSKRRLTKREEELIRYALENGFYDIPRKITLEDIASRFNLSVSTVSEIIRRGEKKILEEFFEKY